MGRLTMTAILMVVGLSACHAGFGIGSNDKPPASVATTALVSAEAQASIASDVPAN